MNAHQRRAARRRWRSQLEAFAKAWPPGRIVTDRFNVKSKVIDAVLYRDGTVYATSIDDAGIYHSNFSEDLK